ncbi:c-type cytochrome [Pseudomonas sp. UL073]|uniref:C-type cytochrome n=1 Tax=Zestomonas insulae TaxID=2809017 RepID=A0ABS2IKN9_9GAMM|nr:c-type cytochrome [Pseudomonas insulae]MBM7062939.1 c-type cytochrome [Pseudomonas insulae]
MHNKNLRLSFAGLAVLLLSQALQAAPACAPAAVEKGSAAFASDCAVCHAVKDTPGMMGPSLGGVIGRTSGSLPGFSYSQAMKSKAQAWDAQSIAAFIEQPQAAVPGTYMPYAGMADAASRDAVACFLSQQ